MSAFGGKADITVKTGPLRGVFLCLRAGYRQRALMMKFSVFAAIIIASVTFVASSTFAYHPYHDPSRGGGSIVAVLPIIIVVALGMVGLGIWDRKKRKTKSKRKHKRR